ncbi:MAG: PHP domain-containing protein [Anaerolineae bacterium]|nr:PHP domain-containing protein [Anaerolineae bacterium]
MDDLIKVDFHSHSQYSPDSLTRVENLIRRARKVGLDRLVLTDHNTIQGALIARDLAPDLIIVGEEIQTTSGEILAIFVTEQVPAKLSPLETIERLKQQGAFISVSHPFDPYRSGWALEELIELAPLVDAIETHNARCWNPQFNQQAQAFARQHDLPGTTGSDAHLLPELGGSYLQLPPFDSAAQLRQVIRQGESVGRYLPPLSRLGSRFASLWNTLAAPFNRS